MIPVRVINFIWLFYTVQFSSLEDCNSWITFSLTILISKGCYQANLAPKEDFLYIHKFLYENFWMGIKTLQIKVGIKSANYSK